MADGEHGDDCEAALDDYKKASCARGYAQWTDGILDFTPVRNGGVDISLRENGPCPKPEVAIVSGTGNIIRAFANDIMDFAGEQRWELAFDGMRVVEEPPEQKESAVLSYHGDNTSKKPIQHGQLLGFGLHSSLTANPDEFLSTIPSFNETVVSVVGFDCHLPPTPKVDHYVLCLARLSAARSKLLAFIEHEGPVEISRRLHWAVTVSVLMGSVDKLTKIVNSLDETVEPVMAFGKLLYERLVSTDDTGGTLVFYQKMKADNHRDIAEQTEQYNKMSRRLFSVLVDS